MAEHGDMKMHSETYKGFLTLLKVGTGASLVVAAIVVFLLAN